jgi:hypothetical protein
MDRFHGLVRLHFFFQFPFPSSWLRVNFVVRYVDGFLRLEAFFPLWVRGVLLASGTVFVALLCYVAMTRLLLRMLLR